jgi:hypothetical protein
MNPYWGSESCSLRSIALYIDSSGCSKPQPVMPCGKRHASASAVLALARLATPPVRSIHGRGTTFVSSSVAVGTMPRSSSAQ